MRIRKFLPDYFSHILFNKQPISFFDVLVNKIGTDFCNNITFLRVPTPWAGQAKKVIKKGHPGEKTGLFRRNKVRWQENMRCAERVEARCQGVACVKPAWRQTGFDIYFLEFFGTFCFKTKSTIKRYNI